MKKANRLFNCFEIIYIVVMSLVFLVSLTGTQRNIEWHKELFVTVVLFGGMMLLYVLLNKMEHWIERYEKRGLVIFLVLWSALLYSFCFVFHNEPAHDYMYICQEVQHYVSGDVVDWSYFALFKNNFFLFLILVALTRVSLFIGLADPFPIWLLASVALVVWAGICLYRIVRMTGHRVVSCFMTLLFFVGFVPLWGGTYNLYTDCLSLCVGIWACYLLKRASVWKHSWLAILLAGFVWGIGAAIKATVVISLIAVFIVAFLTKEWKKSVRLLVFVMVGFLLADTCVEFMWKQYPCSSMEEEYAAPMSYWFAVGLCGNGSHPGNPEFADACLTTLGSENKKKIVDEHVRANIQELWNPEHLIQKARYNFASGNMGLPDYNRYNTNIMYEFFNDYGVYGGYTVMYTSGYFYAILVLGIISSVLALLRKREETDELAVVIRMTVLGLVLFLMLFEANNRQLYNHIPWFALMGGLGCEKLLTRLRKV